MAARRRRVVWTEHSRIALDEVLAHIAEESLPGAQHILHAALDLAASLETLSERGRVVPEIRDPRIREVFLHRYRLIYEVAEEEARVLTFLHGARDFARIKKSRVPKP